MSRLPTYEECIKSDDPTIKHQWALVGLPFHGQTPFTIEEALRPQWSQQLEDLGYVHDPSRMKKKFRPPHRGQQHTLNGAGYWVDIDDPDPEPAMIPDVSSNVRTRHEQEHIAQQLRDEGVIHEQKSAPDVAGVISADPFNPRDHTASAVNGYLMAPISIGEKRRVLAAEMTGKKRQGILNAPANRGI